MMKGYAGRLMEHTCGDVDVKVFSFIPILILQDSLREIVVNLHHIVDRALELR